MFTRGWGMKCIQAHYSRDEGLSEFQIQLLFTTDKFSHGETWHKDYIYKRFTKIILFCQQLYFQNILPEQFVKGKDFSNLVPDSWLHSSRLEYHVRFYSVDVKWTDSNSTSSRMEFELQCFRMQGSFAPVRVLFSPFDGSKILPPFAQKPFGFYKLRSTFPSEHNQWECRVLTGQFAWLKTR